MLHVDRDAVDTAEEDTTDMSLRDGEPGDSAASAGSGVEQADSGMSSNCEALNEPAIQKKHK